MQGGYTKWATSPKANLARGLLWLVTEEEAEGFSVVGQKRDEYPAVEIADGRGTRAVAGKPLTEDGCRKDDQVAVDTARKVLRLLVDVNGRAVAEGRNPFDYITGRSGPLAGVPGRGSPEQKP